MKFLSPNKMIQNLKGTKTLGLYYIRAKSENVILSLSDELHNEFRQRLSVYGGSPDSLVIYIGKAGGAKGLYQRLRQDLIHSNPASFFRGVGVQ